MSAQTDLKARAKSAIVNQLSSLKEHGLSGMADISVFLSAEGYKVSPTTIRRYMAELIQEGLVVKDGILFKSAPQVEEVEETIMDVLEIIKTHTQTLIAQENIAEIHIQFFDGREETINNITSMEQLEEVLPKIIPDQDLVGSFSVYEAESSEEETAEEKKDHIADCKKEAGKILDQGRSAQIYILFQDGTDKEFVVNSMDRLEKTLPKIIPNPDTLEGIVVGEVTAPPSVVKTSEPEPVQENKSKPKGRRTILPPAGKPTAPASPATPTKKTTPVQPAKKTSKYTRANALVEALSETRISSKDALIELSNKHYVKHGGKDNLKESKWFFGQVIGVLELIGKVSIQGNSVEVIK